MTWFCVMVLALPAAAQSQSSPPSRAAISTRPSTRATATGPATVRKPSSRMLEDILIEGEIPVPQVLFVTARDQRRFLTSSHRRYLATSQQLGQSTLLPAGVVVTRTPGEPAKETPR